jgi:signal transduction histidine kinase/ActR/RegA family two-component response regulator
VSAAAGPSPNQRRDPVRVFLWDDAREVREVAREVLDEDPRFTVVGDTGTPAEALEQIAARRPDVVLLDLAMPEMDGLEALPRIGEVAPEARVVVFSGFESARMAEPALARGARAYVEKGTQIARLREIVLDVAAGPAGLSPRAPGLPDVDVPGSPERRASARPAPPRRAGARSPVALPGTVADPLLAVGIAALLFLLILVIPFVTPGRIDGITLLATLPTALLALRFGLVAGLAGASVSLGIILVMSETGEVGGTGLVAWVARVVVFLLLGGLLGLVVDRARTALAASAFANEELERSNADLEQFAAAASHDLSEPLRGIAGFADLLHRRYGPQLDEPANTYIDYISDSAERLRLLVDDLLAYARMGSGFAERTAVDCNRLVDDVLSHLATAIEESGAEVEVGELPLISADPGLMGQVFQNLIGNAVKFTAGERPRVRVWSEREPGGYRFGVSDNGIGVPPGEEERIFQVFKRLHARDDYAGTGVGLAICRRAIERHGGTIWVESRPGGGSVFCFTVTDPDDAR